MGEQALYQDPDCVDHVANAIAEVHGFRDFDDASPIRREIFRRKARAALMNEQDKVHAKERG